MRKLKIFEHISPEGVIQVRGEGEDGDYFYGDWISDGLNAATKYVASVSVRFSPLKRIQRR